MATQDDDPIILPVPVQYTIYVMWTIVTALSIVTVVALLIPLLIQLKKESFHQRRGSMNGSSPSLSSLPRRRQKEPPYSTYNLYLMYLALFDLIVFLPELVLLPPGTSEMIEKLDFTMRVLSIPYVVANLWINAVIARQVFLLLQKSHQGQRISQPSLTRVNLQGGSILVFSVGFGVFIYHWTGDSHAFILPAFLLVTIPFVYVIGMTSLIWWRGYLPSLNKSGSRPSDRAVRSLAMYLFRVTLVFVVIWGPAIILFGLFHFADNRVSLQIAYYLTAIQPIITFGMILTKPDVKKYIRDLVTLSFMNCRNKTEESNEITHRSSSMNASHPMNNSVTILGYDFVDAEQDADIDAEQGVEQNVVNADSRPSP